MDILSILQLLGGIGLFLYGMNLMGSSLEKLAGSGLEQILEKLTTSKKKGVAFIKGWGLGAGVTAIIQSSGCHYHYVDWFCECRNHEAFTGNSCCAGFECR